MIQFFSNLEIWVSLQIKFYVAHCKSFGYAISCNSSSMLIICLNLIIFNSECRSKREKPSLYRDAKGIMYALRDKGVDMAIASRSPTPDIANTFLDKLSMKSLFVATVSIQSQILFVIDKQANDLIT